MLPKSERTLPWTRLPRVAGNFESDRSTSPTFSSLLLRTLNSGALQSPNYCISVDSLFCCLVIPRFGGSVSENMLARTSGSRDQHLEKL